MLISRSLIAPEIMMEASINLLEACIDWSYIGSKAREAMFTSIAVLLQRKDAAIWTL